MILKPLVSSFINSSEFKNLINKEKIKNTYLEGISPASFPLVIASLFYYQPKQLIVLTKNSTIMQELIINLSCFVDPQYLFPLPSWETLPYEFVSPPEKIERERIRALYKIIKDEPAIVVTTVESLTRKIPAKEFLLNKGMTFISNEEYPFEDLIEMLINYGYSREDRVEDFGQFSVKGGIVDIFLSSSENPIRLDFWGDTLESIREFDLASQTSLNKIKEITIYPRKELVLFKKEQEKLFNLFQEATKKNLSLSDEIIEKIKENNLKDFKGLEDFFPLIRKAVNLNDYLNENSQIICLETQDLIAQVNILEKMFKDLFKKKSPITFCLPPEQLFSKSLLSQAIDQAFHLQTFTTSSQALNWNLKSIPNFQGKIKRVREEITERLNQGWKIFVITNFEGQARRLFDLLREYNPNLDFNKIDPKLNFNIIISPLSQGVEIQTTKTLLLSDHEIFGKSYRRSNFFKKKKSRPIESFLDLAKGDYVVHLNHGIGLFKGIERMTAGGLERDFFMLEYANQDKLYVSLDQINMVQKYIGFDNRQPRLDSLGNKSAWNRIKKRVKDSVEEIAKDLIQIYSQRDALKGFQFPPDTLWQEEFEALFEYEETPDQITAIEDVKDDMEKPKPMDRLICGDVGFGKTEVAIRASFKAVMAGKQVAILVPTTVLALQHFSTFQNRFINYPIEIEMISRFRSSSEVKKIKANLNEGRIDIIIGTHALLGEKINIKNLGLLIIDEEQKFGVRHKEKLKKIKTLADVLTLSATPIPRTLHLSLAGIRDLSTIATPPENRQAIETFVLEENPDILKNAILNELARDGQIFYIHNRVQTIEAQAVLLQKLVPEISLAIAHGQMKETELEEIMVSFLKKEYDLLLCTTIIESGLDIPNVNTIIINRADTFGLSQLYQLKGRVGRSNRKAYAYFFYPKYKSLTEEAQKRLKTIAEFSQLGSGLKIAMKDLEIRGAGNILGKEQSGSIMEVGFDLYCQMLDKAVKKLKGEKISSDFRTPVFINTNFYISDDYIRDERQKIEFYKRFEACETLNEIEDLKAELIDRFGHGPPEVMALIEFEKIRALASSIFIEEILEVEKSFRIKISSQTEINLKKIVENIKKKKGLSFDPKNKKILIFSPKSQEREEQLGELQKWLKSISNN